MPKGHIIVEGRYILRSLIRRRNQWAARVRDRITGRVFQQTAREPGKNDARNEIISCLRQMALAGGRDAVRVEFSAAFEEFLLTLTCRPVTIDQCRQVYENGLRPVFGEKCVHLIHFRDVQKYVTKRQAKGNAPRTIAIHVALLRRFFRWAIRMAYADLDPTQGIPIHGPRKDAGTALSEDQARVLLQAALGRNALRLGIAISLYTGLRRKNTFSLTWQHLDLDAGRVSLSGDEMKSHLPHQMPLHRVLVGMLREFRAGQRVIDMSRPLLGITRTCTTSWARATRIAGVHPLRWHDMRHTFGTWMAARCGFGCLQKLLGHSPRGVTIGYIHPSWEEQVEAISRLPNLLEKKGEFVVDDSEAAR